MRFLGTILYIYLVGCPLLAYSQSAFYDLGRSYAEKGNYDEAIRLTRQCLAFDSHSSDKNNLLQDYNALCEYFSYINQPDSCQYYAQKSLDLCKEIDYVGYSDFLRNLSHHFHRAGLFQQAISYREELLKIIESQHGVDSPRLIKEYRILSVFSKDSGNNLLAIKYAKMEEDLAYKTRFVADDFGQRLKY